jgi:hypothetical protein
VVVSSMKMSAVGPKGGNLEDIQHQDTWRVDHIVVGDAARR